MFKRLPFITIMAALLLVFAPSAYAGDDDNNFFPGRIKYPRIAYITTEQLHNQYDEVVIVDTRSEFEFNTLKISSAYNISLNLDVTSFVKQLHELRNLNPYKKIIFYCNGHTCYKSYRAALKAKHFAKLENIYVYDAGIFDWTRAHPDKATLLGQTPVNLNDLISTEKLKKHILPSLTFIKQANEKTIIVDVRSRDQREGFYVFSGFEKKIPLNDPERLIQVIQLAKKQKKDLYIYDEVGKQVRWLQYFLERYNAKNYYFMKGGALAYYDIPTKDLLD